MHLKQIWVYPVKGLRGKKRRFSRLIAGAGLAGDRRRAFLNKRGMEEYQGNWLPSAYLHNLNKVPSMALLKLPFLRQPPQEVSGYAASFVEATDRPFWDYPRQGLSVLNLESLRWLERRAGHPIEAERFRANLIIDGIPPFSEWDWAGKSVYINGPEIAFTRPIKRCATIDTCPASGARQTGLVDELKREFGLPWFGMYAQVVRGGVIWKGARLKPAAAHYPELVESSWNEVPFPPPDPETWKCLS